MALVQSSNFCTQDTGSTVVFSSTPCIAGGAWDFLPSHSLLATRSSSSNAVSGVQLIVSQEGDAMHVSDSVMSWTNVPTTFFARPATTTQGQHPKMVLSSYSGPNTVPAAAAHHHVPGQPIALLSDQYAVQTEITSMQNAASSVPVALAVPNGNHHMFTHGHQQFPLAQGPPAIVGGNYMVYQPSVSAASELYSGHSHYLQGGQASTQVQLAPKVVNGSVYDYQGVQHTLVDSTRSGVQVAQGVVPAQAATVIQPVQVGGYTGLPVVYANPQVHGSIQSSDIPAGAYLLVPASQVAFPAAQGSYRHYGRGHGPYVGQGAMNGRESGGASRLVPGLRTDPLRKGYLEPSPPELARLDPKIIEEHREVLLKYLVSRLEEDGKSLEQAIKEVQEFGMLMFGSSKNGLGPFNAMPGKPQLAAHEMLTDHVSPRPSELEAPKTSASTAGGHGGSERPSQQTATAKTEGGKTGDPTHHPQDLWQLPRTDMDEGRASPKTGGVGEATQAAEFGDVASLCVGEGELLPVKSAPGDTVDYDSIMCALPRQNHDLIPSGLAELSIR